ncbi:MAG: Tyrocidine synthase 3 [Luteibacter sp.]|uniref:amino acid adenylation domain-containing protein n=1 Tax=Luteibacter sp. TaxID=1886636 RepID=UPI001385AC6A|nr:non-ribosomal peptide synthetase [Luteibacter sp.]KAF1006890.1 MAG: Tyrocidine synthase 3 [Luteibacter sp.]
MNATLDNMSRAAREALFLKAQAARRKGGAAARPVGVPARQAPRDHWPVSHAQRRLWFIAHMWPAAHNLPAALRLHGRLDEVALQAAIDRIVQRHEALRTHFDVVDEQPVQRIAATGRVAWCRHDLSGDDGKYDAVAHWRDVEASTPFDIATGPLIRGRLLRLHADEHVLLLTMHHIVSDGWSMGVLAHELGELYRAYAGGLAVDVDPLPALPIQYADYAAWQCDWLVGDIRQRQLAYWTEQLSGAPTKVELPTDRPRPSVQDHRGAGIAFELDVSLTTALKALSQRHGTTLYMTLLGAWAAVVSRLSGQDDVVIGSPVANRTRTEVEPLIGFFVNTLALRVGFGDRPSVAQLLAQVRDAVLQAQDHQDLPFEQVVEALSPRRTLAHTPIFQLAFAWQNTPGDTSAWGDVAVDSLPSREGEQLAQYDLTLELREEENGVAGTLVYATALFDEATMRRHLGYLRAMLRGMVEDDALAMDAMPLVDDEERDQLAAFDGAARVYPVDRPIHAWFEAQARSSPDAVAMEQDGRTWRFRALDEEANGLAHALRDRGVGPEERVALCLRRGPDLIRAMLAVSKAGGAYVPLDPAYPSERLRDTLADCAPRVVLTHADLAEDDALSGEWSILAIDGADRPAPMSDAPVSDDFDGSRLAYVIYTSGSTGRPNGVMVEHRQLVNLVGWHGEAFPLSPGERTSCTAGVAFDACTWEIWPALCHGATLVLPPSTTVGDPSALLDWWEGEDLRTSFLVTALADAALSRGQANKIGLRQLLTGGDRLGRLPSAELPFELVNNYGPTETTVVATSGVLRADDGLVHIGRPIANTRIHLLDRHGRPVPMGAPGEIHIAGAQVARGYLNRPELTAARFLPDPFATEANARMYRTGDLGRWLPDGRLAYLGRNDHQVKIRGLRIEPGEIEARLLAIQGVREATVLAREDVPGERRLVAYVVPTAGVTLEASSLRDALAAVLPGYMVPVAYVTLSALPLTANGKVDRRGLPAPDDAAYAQRAYEAPEGEVEIALARLWSELLGVERVGRQDDFFDLGGHSLLAVRMTSRLRQRSGLDVPVSAVFMHPTLREFARIAAEARPDDVPPLVAGARPRVLPLSFAQQRLWFIAHMGDGASSAYHVPGALRLHGELDIGAMQAALDRIIQRHEALRTRFESVEGLPVQRIDHDATFALAHHDLRDEIDRDEAVERWRRHDAETPFDLSRGPLARGYLLRVADREHVLLLTMHHIVSDGWSIGVFMEELDTLYQAYAKGDVHPGVDPLPALPIQYADYALWQRRWLTGTAQRRLVEFWRNHLAKAPSLVGLPTDLPRPSVQDYRGASIDVVLDAALTAGLRHLSQRHGTTLYMTLLAAWAALVARLSGDEDVVIGSALANRTRAEMEPLIGFFVNTVALRVAFGDRPTVAQLLAQVRDSATQAQGHQDLPFEQVVEALKPPRTLAHTPLFQLMFAWQGASSGTTTLGGLDREALSPDHVAAKFDLTLELGEEGDTIAGTIVYASALYAEDTIRRHVAYLVALLRGMVDDDTRAVDAIPIVCGREARRLAQLHVTERSYPQDRYVHEGFERQARATPDIVAVEQDGHVLTYRELDEAANRLAHVLRAYGVGPEVRVALCLRRGEALVLAMLAVLKAGGPYVPLDPAYPAERLRATLHDCGPRVVLTQKDLAIDGNLDGDWQVLLLDDPDSRWKESSGEVPTADDVDGSRLAYVIYTSGSTGRPNGVLVEHRQLANLIGWHGDAFPLSPGERTSCMAGVAFDACTWEIWPALCRGATLVLPPLVTTGDPVALLDWWEQEDLQTSFLVTALADAALSRGQAERGNLRQLLTGGDRLGRLPSADLPFELINNYGPTETTVVATSGVLRADDTLPHIGRPVANTRIYLLDRHGHPVPHGAPGEIHIGGAQVARGYLNRPELTAARFLSDPFADGAEARMYKTGDLGRWLPDGRLAYLGRNDHQVKIRGLRIEPGEIESRLLEIDAVREAAVLAREDVPGEQRLVAYVVQGDGVRLENASLRDALTRTLPAYMLPSAYVSLDALPLTPNGKVDRRALPAPDAHAYVQRGYDAPQGDAEIALAHLWCELLGVDTVGRRDNFFELGGHSMLLSRLVDGARKAGLAMDLRQVFDAPDLMSLAAIVGVADRVADMHSTMVPIRSAGDEAPLFCFHEGFGTILAYERLARFVDPRIPVYALEARGLHEDLPVYRTVEAMAADYLAQLERIQSAGPYRLTGWSSGGLIAYEVAHQLMTKGETVEFLGLIDTYNIAVEDLEGDIAETTHYLVRTLEYLRPDLAPEILRALLSLGGLDATVEECHRNGWLPVDVTARDMDRRFQVAKDIGRACAAYTPPPLVLDVDLFSASEPAREDRSNGWADVIGACLDVTRMEGSHMSIMQDETLIRRVTDVMNRAMMGTRDKARDERLSKERWA